MEQLKYYYQAVEKAIAQIGLNPDNARTALGKWTITKNNIPVWIEVFYQPKEKNIYFMVGAPIVKTPDVNQLAFYKMLIQENNNLYGVSFVESNGQIYLKTLREAKGLDISEAHAMILRIGNYADIYREKLNQSFPQWEDFKTEFKNSEN